MSHIALRMLFSIICVGVVACSQSSPTSKTRDVAGSSASVRDDTSVAVVVSDDHGKLVTRSPDRDELASVMKLDSALSAIDDKYPVKQPSADDPRFKVIQVDLPGVLRLQNGQTIKIDGVFCKQGGVEKISKKVIGGKRSIIYLLLQNKAASIWIVHDDDQVEMQSFDSLNDDILLNHWCDRDQHSISPNNERYGALIDLGSREGHTINGPE